MHLEVKIIRYNVQKIMNIRSSLFKLYKINQETVFFRHCVYSESGTAKDGHMHIKNMILNKTSQK